MNKKIVSYAILPVLALALLGSGVAFADSKTDGGKPMNELVNALATKFNLKPNDVQQVVDQVMTEQRAAMKADRQAKMDERLAQAVTDKKISQAQADLIIAKQAELKAQRETMKDTMKGKTMAERQDAMKAEMDSLKQWATDNNIPEGFMMFGRGDMGMNHRDGHGHGPRGVMDANSAKPDMTNTTAK